MVSASPVSPAPVRVAQYLRMSTERQEYSPVNQAAAMDGSFPSPCLGHSDEGRVALVR